MTDYDYTRSAHRALNNGGTKNATVYAILDVAQAIRETRRPAAEIHVQVRASVAEVLALHQIESHGMSYGSPDRCSCGAETLFERGDEDVTVSRARAFAAHQADVLKAAGLLKDPS